MKERLKKLFSYRREVLGLGDRPPTTFITVLGLKLIFGWAGNCITNVIHFQRFKLKGGGITFSVTIRLGKLRPADETTVHVYWRNPRGKHPVEITWNCEAIAVRWGEHFQPDCENPHEVDRYEYSGRFGHHLYL